jgi:hypothetical protein
VSVTFGVSVSNFENSKKMSEEEDSSFVNHDSFFSASEDEDTGELHFHKSTSYSSTQHRSAATLQVKRSGSIEIDFDRRPRYVFVFERILFRCIDRYGIIWASRFGE